MRLPIETLESRRLLAATLTDGVLTIDGTAAADSIRVSQSGSTITVRDGVTTTTIDAGQVDEVVINAGDGNDRVRADRLARPAIVDGGAGDDRIYGGNDDDILDGGDGDDRLYGRGGDDSIEGGAGSDLLVGDAGDDDLAGGDGADRINGGAGTDTADIALDTITGVEVFPGLPPGFTPVGRPRVIFGGGNTRIGSGFGEGTLIIPVSGPASLDPLAPGFIGFPDNFAFPGHAGFPSTPSIGQQLPVGVTGLEPTVGVSTISPALSRQPAANQVVFRPGVGLFIRSGNAEIQLNAASTILRQDAEGLGGWRDDA